MSKRKKTARISAKPWMFRLPFKVYGAEKKREKKLNVKKMKRKTIKKKIEIFFCEKHHPTRHLKYKVINFAPSNKSVEASKLPSTNLERLLKSIKSSLTR